jgi:putative copper resistance protein D
MLPDLSNWDFAGLVFKLLWYLGVFASVGGTASMWLLTDSSRRGLTWSLAYSLTGALLGFHAVILYFLTQVGAANNAGLRGMLDWSMIRFYMDLEIGETSLLRMAVFLLLVLGQIGVMAYLGRLTRPPGQAFFRLFYRLNAAALLLLLLSFQATGHVAPLSLPARIALVLHVTAVALWLGSLLPLLRATRIYDFEQAQVLLSRFSSRATFMVVVLLIAAFYLLVELLTAPQDLIFSAYGLSLLIKAVLVCGLLSLAALNRWWLVPQLTDAAAVLRIRRSITAEMVTAVLILFVTVFLSTVIGPPSHS